MKANQVIFKLYSQIKYKISSHGGGFFLKKSLLKKV